MALITAVVIGLDLVVSLLPAATANADSKPIGGFCPKVHIAEAPTAMARTGPTMLPWPSPSDTPEPTPTPAPTPKPRVTPKPAPPDTVANARAYIKATIGVRQYNCIDNIFIRESNWNPLAGNPTGAYGIPQAFPGTKMASMGANWRTSPLTQVKWGIWYVNQRYGSACDAWAFWQDHAWY